MWYRPSSRFRAGSEAVAALLPLGATTGLCSSTMAFPPRQFAAALDVPVELEKAELRPFDVAEFPRQHGPEHEEHERHHADQIGGDRHRTEALDVVPGNGRRELRHLVDEARAGHDHDHDRESEHRQRASGHEPPPSGIQLPSHWRYATRASARAVGRRLASKYQGYDGMTEYGATLLGS